MVFLNYKGVKRKLGEIVKNKIKTEQRSLLWDNLLENNYIIKNINFNYDIDKELNERCRYNISLEGCLNFFYEIIEEITKDDCKLIAEDIVGTEQRELLPKMNVSNKIEKEDIYSHYFVTKEIDNKYLICINHSGHVVPYYFMLANKEYKEKLDKVYDEKIEINKGLLEEDKIDGFISYTWNNGCWINQYKNNAVIEKNEQIYHQKPIIQKVLNVKENKMIMWDINGKKCIKYIKNLNSFEKRYILLSIKTSDINKIGLEKFIKNLALGKKEGYIYFKPIQVKVKSVQAFMIYSGNPNLQYFNKRKSEWENIREGQKLDVYDNIKLRVKMSSGDRIEGIVFVSPKEKNFNGYNLLKEINFSNDLNVEPSDKFYIDEMKSYLQFLYGIDRKVELDNVIPLANVDIDKNNISFMPTTTEKDSWIKNRGISDCLLNEAIEPEERELIIVNFSKERNVNFFIQFLYDSSYRKALDVLNGDGFLNEIVRSNESHTLLHSFGKDKLELYIAKEFDSDVLGIYRLEQMKNFSYLINFKEGYVQLNKFEKQVARIYNDKLILKDTLHLYMNCIDFEDFISSQRKAEVSEIIYGLQSGFVYFKPIKIESRSFFVKINSVGNPVLQYYIKEKEKWIDIQNEVEVENIKELRMRVKMSIDDLIYNIVILEHRQ